MCHTNLQHVAGGSRRENAVVPIAVQAVQGVPTFTEHLYQTWLEILPKAEPVLTSPPRRCQSSQRWRLMLRLSSGSDRPGMSGHTRATLSLCRQWV